jgi:amino acid adenylation domain-containing protein
MTFLEENCADQPALKVLTWKSFAEKVEDLATHLQSLPRGRISVILKRSCSMPIAQAACHLAGRTFVPIDPTWPVWRISKIILRSESVAAIVDEGSHLILEDIATSQTGFALVPLNTSSECTVQSAHTRFTPFEKPEIMYVTYTSGSTGEPKGVEVYTDGVQNFLEWKAEALKVTSSDVFILKTPFTFDVGIGEMWLPLVTGTTSHVLGDGLHLEADKVYESLVLGQVTICHFVPSVLTLFLSQIRALQTEKRNLPPLDKLRMIQATGEALKPEHRIQLSKILRPDIELVNLYGPTEASIEVTYMYCEEKEEQYLSHGFPIGFVPKGVDIFITDVEDPTRLVPDGDKGEICIAGIQVAKGYLNLPEKTNERFLPCPWSSSKNERNFMYRTGDLGRRNPHTGWLEYNGRFDRQVKIGGVRIELGEIESVVMSLFDDVLEAAVVLLIDKQLVGVLVPKEGLSPTKLPSTAQISDGILSQLPKAYKPQEWHAVQKDDLPLSTAGKIDFNALEKHITNEQSVSVWAEVYDQLYDNDDCTNEAGADPTMDWASYKDSFNPSSLHRRDVVTEWVMETVKIVLSLAKESAGSEKSSTVCEMGCGKGMIILKVAPQVKAAVCGDISNFAVKHVRKVWDGFMKDNNMQGCCKEMHIVPCDAAAFEKLPIDRYNVVLCNGVSMYLPSFTYLLSYFDGAIARITKGGGGAVVLGDVRSLHHSAIFQLRRLMQVGRTAEEARQQAGEFARDDKDRTYDYRSFYALYQLGHLSPDVQAVEVQLKMGALDSEFTGYRFDVIYHVGQDDDEEEKKSSCSSSDVFPVTILADMGNKESNVTDIVSLLKRALNEAGNKLEEKVFGILKIQNQRLYSDHLVASSQRDDIGYATPGVGIKPHELRRSLEAALPGKHIVLSWSREIGDATKLCDVSLASMDVYVVPTCDRSSKLAGLRGICQFALDPHASFLSKLTGRSSYECCISEIYESKSSSAENVAGAVDAAKKFFEAGDVEAAVQTTIAWSLGHTRETFQSMLKQVDDKVTFEELGGNSFMAMKLIQQLRTNLGAAPAVFKLLTEPMLIFLGDAVDILKRKRESGQGEWIIQGQIGETMNESSPTIAFFPTAGGSPKVRCHIEDA